MEWTREQEKLLFKKYLTTNNKELSKLFGVSKNAVQKKKARMGYIPRWDERRHQTSTTSDGHKIIRSTVAAPGTDTTPYFYLRIVDLGSEQMFPYRVDLYTEDDDGNLEELLADPSYKTKREAAVAFQAMWQGTMATLGKIGVFAEKETE